MQKRFNWASKARKAKPVILIIFSLRFSAFARKYGFYEFIITKKGT